MPAALDKSDLVGCGIIGLLEAYERFDPTQGVKFLSYAVMRIRGAMIDEIRKVSLAPRSFFARLHRIQEAMDNLRPILGREPTCAEIASHLDWPEQAVEQVWSQYNLLAVISLEALLFSERGENELTLGDVLPAPGEDPDHALVKKERQQLLARALEKLPEREQLLLSLYYKEELTQKEIAELMNVSTVRVSQIHARAIRRLQELLADQI